MVVGEKGKYLDVVTALRNSIVEGTYRPSSQLPIRSEMVEAFGVSNATIQRALNRLVSDGFVFARPSGTFVTERLPHLWNYGLVTPIVSQWSLLHTAIRKAAGIVQTGSDIRFNEYFTSSEAAMREDVTRLCRDVSSYRLGGLIILGDPAVNDITGTSALEQEGAPYVRVHAFPESSIPMVGLDVVGSFIPKATEYLTSRGCRRIAHLRLVSKTNWRNEFDAALRKTGVEVRPYWVQSVFAGALDETTANIVVLLMQLEGDNRPDALIIHDDNLIDFAVGGLLAAGVKVPDELEVVAHSNYPSPAPSALPMKRLGLDCRMFLRKSVEVMELQRSGKTLPAKTKLPALFEDELAAED